MSKTTQKIKQVCKCENCGNEAEMVITCTLPETSEPAAPEAPAKIKAEEKTAHKLKG